MLKVTIRLLLTGCMLFSMLSVALQGHAAARINSTTRNRSVSKIPVVVAKNGVAKLPVIIAENADAETKAVAGELVGFLGRITGATIVLKPGGVGPGICVGTLAEFPTPSADAGLKIFDIYDGREAYAIRTERGSIKLLGATHQGVGYAVSRFLELLGCRFFFQSPVWTVVPKAATVTFNLNETDRPELLSRRIGYDSSLSFEKSDPDAGSLLLDWRRHNRVGRSLQTTVGHCWPEIIARFKKEFDAHPEYLALVNGKRQGGQLCVSNPAVIQLAIRYADDYFDKHPDADMLGVGPADGGGYCTCPECAKLGNPGNQAFNLANAVAKALQESHPGKFAGLYAYNWHCDPPPFTLEPNVYVELTTALLLNTKYGFDELLERWPKVCRLFSLYDYWGVYEWYSDQLPSGRTGNTRYLTDQLPRYVAHGICGLWAQCTNSWGAQGLGYYLGARLLWNSSTDAAAVKKDFYQKAFGPAAVSMQTYYERIDLGNKPLVGTTFSRLCLDDLDKAEKAARGRPDVLARIQQLKAYHVFLYLHKKTNQRGLDEAERKKYALDLMTWNYRIRNDYMTFWSFFAMITTKQMAEQYQEPTWSWFQMLAAKKGDEIPYRNPAPVTAVETDQWLRKIKAEYGDPPPVAEVRFGARLAAPKWEAAPITEIKPFYSQNPFCLALASTGGEPLRFTLEHGTLYKNFPDGKYTVTDGDGKVVSTGRVPYGKNSMALKVPAAGVYYFRYDDFAAGAVFTPSAGTKAAYILERGGRFTVYNHAALYFYVPKGTGNLQLYASRGNPVGVCRPDGKWVGEDRAGQKPDAFHRYLSAEGAYQVIPVPKGMDGKVWTAMEFVSGSYHFFNIPNIFAVSPDHVLVPEEVAVKDGIIPPKTTGQNTGVIRP